MSAIERALKNCLADYHAVNVRYRHLAFSSKDVSELENSKLALKNILSDYTEWDGFYPDEKSPPTNCSRSDFIRQTFNSLLANIHLYENQPRQQNYIRHLPEMFHDSALIDRFHGIIAGWEIPRFMTESAALGVGIKADVFGEYLHQLRIVSHIEFPFGECPNLKGDNRDVKAVTRIATALSKLLLLNPDHPDYETYVLNPAKALRQRVRSQLAELDPHEFSESLNAQ